MKPRGMGWASLGLGVGRLSEQLQIPSEEVKTDRIIEPRFVHDSRTALPAQDFPR